MKGQINLSLCKKEEYGNKQAVGIQKNKANMPAFGRKSEALSTKSETIWKDLFEKTKPICSKQKLT